MLYSVLHTQLRNTPPLLWMFLKRKETRLNHVTGESGERKCLHMGTFKIFSNHCNFSRCFHLLLEIKCTPQSLNCTWCKFQPMNNKKKNTSNDSVMAGLFFMVVLVPRKCQSPAEEGDDHSYPMSLKIPYLPSEFRGMGGTLFSFRVCAHVHKCNTWILSIILFRVILKKNNKKTRIRRNSCLKECPVRK